MNVPCKTITGEDGEKNQTSCDQVEVLSAYSYVDAERGLFWVYASSVGLGIAMLFLSTLNLNNIFFL